MAVIRFTKNENSKYAFQNIDLQFFKIVNMYFK